MNKILKEITVIVLFSAFLGLIYHAVSGNEMPFFPLSEDEKTVKDSLLFSGKSENNKHSADIENLEGKTVSFQQMLKIVEDERFYIIDARNPEVYNNGYIDNAVNIFPYLQDENEFIALITQVPFDKKIIIYCDGGTCDLSHEVASVLEDFGYQEIYLYEGGWEEWTLKNNL